MHSTFDFLPADEKWFLAYDHLRSHKPTAQINGYSREDYEAEIARLVRLGHDVWTARAGFDGAAKTRTAKNVRHVRCFSIDIDVNSSGSVSREGRATTACHTNQIDAAVSLFRIAADKIPVPTVVTSSGGGLHAWWLLTDELTPAEWKPIAAALRAVIIAEDPKLAADTTRWTDVSGLLRPWPSLNFKTGVGRKVDVVRDTGIVHDPVAFAKELSAQPITRDKGAARDANAMAKPARKRASGVDEPQRTLLPLSEIEDTCGVLAHYRTHLQGTATEPQWRAALSVVCSAVEWESAIHAYSKGHPDYDPADTIAKAEKIVEADAPLSCGKIRADIMGDAEDRSACAGCPFAHLPSNGRTNFIGAVREHAVQGRRQPTATPSTPESQGEAMFETCDELETALGAVELPSYVDLSPTGASRYYVARQHDDDGDGAIYAPAASGMVSVQIFTPAWWVDRHCGERSLIAWMRGGVTQTAFIRREALSTYDLMVRELAKHGIAAPGNRTSDVKHGTLSYAKLLHERAPRAEAYNNCGVQPRGEIVIGQVAIDEHGDVRRAALHSRYGASVLDRIVPHGRLQASREVLDIVGREGSQATKFVAVASLGSLLLGLIRSQGALIHLNGEGDTGKTMTQAIASSFWGRPREYMQNGQDTFNATMAHAGMLGSLPLVIDELTLMRDTDIDALAYAITSGRPKRANTRGGGDRDTSPPWAFNAISSANRSVRAIVAAQSSNDDEDEAKQSRVIELRFTHAIEGGLQRQHDLLHRIRRLVEDHHGLMGIEWGRHVARNAERLRRTMHATHAALAAKYAFCRRFIGASLASFIVAGAELRRLGLWPASADDDMQVVSYVLRAVRSGLDEEAVAKRSFLLREVIAAARRNALIFKETDPGQFALINGGDAVRDPWARVEIHANGETWIEAPADLVARIARDAAHSSARRAIMSRRVGEDTIERKLQLLREGGRDVQVIEEQMLFRGAPLRYSQNSVCRVVRVRGDTYSAADLRALSAAPGPRLVAASR